MKIKNFFRHLRTIQKHRKEVRKLCFSLGLYWQGIIHDLSKYSPTEFINGIKYYTGICSPHIEERKNKGYSAAWLHHKGRNKHHSDYWMDINIETGKTEPIPMPRKYLLEMICDRVAASKTYLKDKYNDTCPLEYYISHKDEHEFHYITKYELESALTYIATCGFLKGIELWLDR